MAASGAKRPLAKTAMSKKCTPDGIAYRYALRNGQVWVGARMRRLRCMASLRFNRALTRKSFCRPPWPAATRDWCCARSAANDQGNDPRH
jgi:hypothetical protein